MVGDGLMRDRRSASRDMAEPKFGLREGAKLIRHVALRNACEFLVVGPFEKERST